MKIRIAGGSIRAEKDGGEALLTLDAPHYVMISDGETTLVLREDGVAFTTKDRRETIENAYSGRFVEMIADLMLAARTRRLLGTLTGEEP